MGSGVGNVAKTHRDRELRTGSSRGWSLKDMATLRSSREDPGQLSPLTLLPRDRASHCSILPAAKGTWVAQARSFSPVTQQGRAQQSQGERGHRTRSLRWVLC